jgi:hypothetical protein
MGVRNRKGVENEMCDIVGKMHVCDLMYISVHICSQMCA